MAYDTAEAPKGEDIAWHRKRLTKLKADRSTLDNQWQEIAEVMLPPRSQFTKTRTPGEKRMQSVFDGTALECVELMASGLNSIATNAATDWFSARLINDKANETDAGKEYCQAVTEAMRAEAYAPDTGLETALDEVYLEATPFGTAVMFIGERDDGGLLYQGKTIAKAWIAQNYEGVTDTIYLQESMTARNMIAKWPDTVSQKVRKMAEKEPDTPVEVVTAVVPRKKRDPSLKGQKDMPYACVWYELDAPPKGQAEVGLEEGGFPEFPFAVLLWRKNAGETYAWSQGMLALPDTKMLQSAEQSVIQTMQYNARPTMALANESVIGPYRLEPGGSIIYKGQQPPTPIANGGNMPVVDKWLEQKRNAVRRLFYSDIFQLPLVANASATEMQIRYTQQMRVLGPVAGRLIDFLSQWFVRTFGILHRKGKLPPPPQELIGQAMTIQFVSPISTAQRATEAGLLTQAFMILEPMIAADVTGGILKAVTNRIEKDKLWGWVCDKIGVTPELVVDDDTAQANAEAEKKQQQAAMMAAAAPGLAAAGADATKSVDNLASAKQKGADIPALMSRMGMQ